jgi:hypothetical protein
MDPARALPQHVDGVVSRTLGRKLVLYNPESREVSVLNATAAIVWELCDGQTPVAEAVARLRARFRVAESRDVTEDVAAVVRTLTRQGLLREAGHSGGPI